MAVHTEPEREARSDFEGTQAKARTTKLTEEAKAHLTAAGHFADSHFAITRAMIESAISPLIEANRHIGFELTLSDEEVTRVVMAVRGALDYGQEEVVEPIFARLRGEAPHVSVSADQPHLSLEEKGVRELVTDVYRLASATTLDKDSDEEEIRRRLDAIARLAEVTADRICEAAGIPVHDGTIDEFLAASKPFGQKAGELGREAVEEVES